MEIDKLVLMHNSLRHEESLPNMIEYVVDGGKWTTKYLVEYSVSHTLSKASPLIQLSRFEDGVVYIHDGHHRVVATYLAGRKELFEDEYHLSEWRYADYLRVSAENGWFTPFDPRIHARTPDFAQFKKIARQRFLTNPETAEDWVRENYDFYREDRVFKFVPELVVSILQQMLCSQPI